MAVKATTPVSELT